MSEKLQQVPTNIGEKLTGSSPNMSIWSGIPMLQNVEGQVYLGRVFIEVWDKDVCTVMTSSDLEIRDRTIVALHSLNSKQGFGDKGLTSLQTSVWTHEPATGERTDQPFIGRVIAEIWDNQTVVRFTGTDPKLISRALQELAAIAE